MFANPCCDCWIEFVSGFAHSYHTIPVFIHTVKHHSYVYISRVIVIVASVIVVVVLVVVVQ